MMIILMIIIIVIIMISIIIVVVVVIIVAITEIIPIIAVVTIINSPFQPGDFSIVSTTVCNSRIFKTFVYSEPRHIRNQGYIQNSSSIYDGVFFAIIFIISAFQVFYFMKSIS